MLHAFFGTDTITVRHKAGTFVHEKQNAGAEVIRLEPTTYVPERLVDAVGSVSLFGAPQVIVIDTPSVEPDMFAQVFEVLESFASTKHDVVLIEGKLLAPEKKKLQKYAATMGEYTAESKLAFNTFALADALLERDKKNLWVLLSRAKVEGLGSEEIIGTLFWQLKSLRLAAKTNDPEEAGLKPFVYSKAKRALSKFKDGELEMLSETLVAAYHDGHTGRRDISVALERWVLAL